MPRIRQTALSAQTVPNFPAEPAGGLTPDEFNRLLDDAKMTPQLFAAMTGYTTAQVNRYVNGDSVPPYLVRFAARLMAHAARTGGGDPK